MSRDSDIDETHRTLCKLTGNWATYILTVKTREDLKLLIGKKIITNLKGEPGNWVFREYSADYVDRLRDVDTFAQWEGTQVMFVGDLAEAAGFELEAIV